jgi:hypothetical protein
MIAPLPGVAEFECWNMLDFLPDRFIYPTKLHPFDTNVDSKNGPWATYLISRCWPEIDTIVKRLIQLRDEHAGEMRLRRVYISTNSDTEWANSLKKALLRSGWEAVFSTHDLKLAWKESGVDSAIGEYRVSSHLEDVEYEF